MMMPALFALAFQTASPPPVYIPTDAGPERRTAPLVEYRCQLLDSSGRTGTAAFALGGGRGYWVAGPAGSRHSKLTPRTWLVSRDWLHILAGLKLKSSEYFFPGSTGKLIFQSPSGPYHMNLSAAAGFDPDFSTDSLVLAAGPGDDPVFRVSLLGFCTATLTPQTALTEAETRALKP